MLARLLYYGKVRGAAFVLRLYFFVVRELRYPSKKTGKYLKTAYTAKLDRMP